MSLSICGHFWLSDRILPSSRDSVAEHDRMANMSKLRGLWHPLYTCKIRLKMIVMHVFRKMRPNMYSVRRVRVWIDGWSSTCNVPRNVVNHVTW
jgi:hypothetical protein